MNKSVYTCVTESLGGTAETSTTLGVIHTSTNLKKYSRTLSKNYKGAESKLIGFPEEGIKEVERGHQSDYRIT